MLIADHARSPEKLEFEAVSLVGAQILKGGPMLSWQSLSSATFFIRR